MSSLPDRLAILEDSIRRSVLSDSLEQTPALLDHYVKELNRRLQAAPAELPVLRAQAQALFEWMSQLVLASREEALATVAHLRTLCGYQDAPESPSRVRAEA